MKHHFEKILNAKNINQNSNGERDQKSHSRERWRAILPRKYRSRVDFSRGADRTGWRHELAGVAGRSSTGRQGRYEANDENVVHDVSSRGLALVGPRAKKQNAGSDSWRKKEPRKSLSRASLLPLDICSLTHWFQYTHMHCIIYRPRVLPYRIYQSPRCHFNLYTVHIIYASGFGD